MKIAARSEKNHEPLSRQVSGEGFMASSTRFQRLERRDTIPVGEEGTRAAIILVARFLRHRTWPGIGQLALKAVIAKQHVGNAFAFR